MSKEHASREDGAAAEIESQTILSAQAGRVFNCEQFTVDGLRTLFRYVLERVEDLVTQLRDETEHELYDRVRQEYGAFKERLGHTEAAVSRLAETLCEVKCSLKEMERLRAHRGDATQTFEPAPTRHDPSRTLGYPGVVLNKCCRQQKPPRASKPCQCKPKTPLCMPLHSLPLGRRST